MVSSKMIDLAISIIPGISLREKVFLSKEFDTRKDFSFLLKKDIENLLRRLIQNPVPAMEIIYKEALHIAETAERRGISWASYSEKEYPPLLRELIDPPLVVFYRGVLPNPEQMLVGMVGTRKPSAEAMAQSYDFSKALGSAGIPVVSGLALGIDAMCHRGNIEGGAPTIAVLGSGPDMIYPSSNRMIAARILDHGGCIMSEYAPGTKPMKWHFPARNRIISGLSRGLIVVEAPLKSGALITAQFALEQGRDIWIASSGLSERSGAGTIELHEDGASILHDIKTLFDEYEISIEYQNKYERSFIDEKGFLSEQSFTNNERSFTGVSLASELARSLDIKI
jgi:DNA processing protein